MARLLMKDSRIAMAMWICLLLVASVLALTGCASMSPDDRDIFYSGWVHPNSGPPTQ